MDKCDYLKELENIVGDRETYAPFPANPRTSYRKLLEDIVDRGFTCGILNKKEKAFLVPTSSRIPIYYLPKVHKNLVHPLGCTIISEIDSITSRAGKYIDGFLQPLVKSLPAYIKDSKHQLMYQFVK